jgi:hypothetical protein
MSIFLVVYDRRKGVLLSLETFDDAERDEAESQRLKIELDSVERKLGHEVVLLEAGSEVELRRTHARYFKKLEDFAPAGF